MRPCRVLLAGIALVAVLSVGAIAIPAFQFVVFPLATELISPEGRYAVRSVNSAGAASDFVEGSRVEQDTLHPSVWGYGQHDTNGFRYRCEYSLR